MIKSLLIACVLVLAVNKLTFAQEKETDQKPVVDSLNAQKSFQKYTSGHHSQTLGEALSGSGPQLFRKPLIIVDGETATGVSKPDPMDTKVSDILSISVVKDSAKLAQYGSDGVNGVILITTKQGKLK